MHRDDFEDEDGTADEEDDEDESSCGVEHSADAVPDEHEDADEDVRCMNFTCPPGGNPG